MQHISATDAKQTFALLLETAQREPVVIRKQNRDVAVVLSMQEYEKLTQLNWEEFDRIADRIAAKAKQRGMTPDILQKLLADDTP